MYMHACRHTVDRLYILYNIIILYRLDNIVSDLRVIEKCIIIIWLSVYANSYSKMMPINTI